MLLLLLLPSGRLLCALFHIPVHVASKEKEEEEEEEVEVEKEERMKSIR